MKIEDQMTKWTKIVDLHQELQATGNDARQFLLTLQFRANVRWKLSVKAYNRSEEQRASDDRIELEKQYINSPGVQVALVAVESIDKLRIAYPNYYGDTAEFLKTLQQVLHSNHPFPNRA